VVSVPATDKNYTHVFPYAQIERGLLRVTVVTARKRVFYLLFLRCSNGDSGSLRVTLLQPQSEHFRASVDRIDENEFLHGIPTEDHSEKRASYGAGYKVGNLLH